MNAQFDITGVRIETPRLILRPWCESDLLDFHEYARVEGVGEMAGWPHHKSLEDTEIILRKFIDHRKTFALELKHNKKVIGSLGIEKLDPDPVEGEFYGREIGYVLSKDYWGNGLMPEAVGAVIDYCFHVLGYDYLTCGHFERNDRSRRVIEKSGFRYFGESEYKTRYGTVEIARNYILYNPKRSHNNV